MDQGCEQAGAGQGPAHLSRAQAGENHSEGLCDDVCPAADADLYLEVIYPFPILPLLSQGGDLTPHGLNFKR